AASLRRGDRRAGPRARAAHVRAPDDLGAAGAGGRDRPAPASLRASGPALVRLLRPPPDRTADVTRDGRPTGGPLLSRLRADLLLPEHAHGRFRHGCAAVLPMEAGPDRPRDHAGPRRAR